MFRVRVIFSISLLYFRQLYPLIFTRLIHFLKKQCGGNMCKIVIWIITLFLHNYSVFFCCAFYQLNILPFLSKKSLVLAWSCKHKLWHRRYKLKSEYFRLLTSILVACSIIRRKISISDVPSQWSWKYKYSLQRVTCLIQRRQIF